MNLLFSLQAIAAGVILLGTLLVLTVAIFLPKRPGEIVRRVGRWFQGF